MTRVVCVRFRTAGKIYYFDPVQYEIKKGSHVIVETARGIEFGTVVGNIREVEDDKVIQPLKPVIRLANERDKEQEAENRKKEREAFKVCAEKIRKHDLDMKLIDAEYTFDNNKVLFYFTADGRIDFRELVKDLAAVFKTRIELRQIGVRDETKILGGLGICGRVLCCHAHLSDFIPVSIKMAKEQNLSLNPTKISGVCGRLMCCLKHEQDTYEELNRNLPGIGDYVVTEDGLKGEVQSVNVLRQLVKVVVDVDDEKEIHEYPVDQLQFRRRAGKKGKGGERDKLDHTEDLAAVEALEKAEKAEAAEIAERPSKGERPERTNRPRPDRNRERNSDRSMAERSDKSGDRPERNQERFGKRGNERGNRNRDRGRERDENQLREGNQERGKGSERDGENRGRDRKNFRERRRDNRPNGERRGERNHSGNGKEPSERPETSNHPVKTDE